jgi:hypothetical protein
MLIGFDPADIGFVDAAAKPSNGSRLKRCWISKFDPPHYNSAQRSLLCTHRFERNAISLAFFVG